MARPTFSRAVAADNRRFCCASSGITTPAALNTAIPRRLGPSERTGPVSFQILFGSGIGSDVMKPIAAPIVGGMITSTIQRADFGAGILCAYERTSCCGTALWGGTSNKRSIEDKRCDFDKAIPVACHSGTESSDRRAGFLGPLSARSPSRILR